MTPPLATTDPIALLRRLADLAPEAFAANDDFFDARPAGCVEHWVPLRQHALPEQDLWPFVRHLADVVKARSRQADPGLRWDWGMRSAADAAGREEYRATVWWAAVESGAVVYRFEGSGAHPTLALAAALVEALEQSG